MASVTASPLPMETADDATPARRPVARRRLRTRIILSFLLFGTGLTLLFAFATNWARQRVENQMIEDVKDRLDSAGFKVKEERYWKQ